MNPLDWLVNFISAFPVYVLLVGVPLISLTVIFAPESILESLQAVPLRENYSHWFGFALIASVCFLAVAIAGKIVDFIQSYCDRRSDRIDDEEKLKNLSPVQKAILKLYLDKKTTTLSLLITGVDIDDELEGEIEGLEDQDILTFQTAGTYRITPEAKKNLERNRDLIEKVGEKPLEKFSAYISSALYESN